MPHHSTSNHKSKYSNESVLNMADNLLGALERHLVLDCMEKIIETAQVLQRVLLTTSEFAEVDPDDLGCYEAHILLRKMTDAAKKYKESRGCPA